MRDLEQEGREVFDDAYDDFYDDEGYDDDIYGMLFCLILL